ncbi:MAG TPA: amino acid permease [Verrucomicrobiae bacterium]|jgi:AAT family amino acid transporter|nr:amino acid permease [Verrucomicrobiae bacterium]
MDQEEHGLKRELSARQMAMVAVGGSIGTGLLLGSGFAIKVAGPGVIVSYVISALMCWTVALAMGEMSSVHPAAGSFGVYAELYLNPWAGFVARYGYWFSVVIAIGSELVAAGTYMRAWFPHVPVVIWMVVFGFLLLAVNFFPVGNYGTFEYWFAFIKVITIFLFIVIGGSLLFSGKVPRQYVTDGGFFPNGWSAALLAASFGLYSFLGIEMVAISSGEARSGAEVAKATRLAFTMLAFLYVGAMAVLVGVMPWRHAGGAESPFVTVFNVAGIPAAGAIMNLVVLSAALSGANATLYVASRMLFSLARSGYAPAGLGKLNTHGVPMSALLVSLTGIVAAILVQLKAPERAYVYIINTALVGGMLAWLVSLAAHVRFRQVTSREQIASLPLRAPMGAAGSVLGFISITAAIIATAWVDESRVTVECAGPYLLVLSVAYWLAKKRGA